jgi:shikimate dehydrogenase
VISENLSKNYNSFNSPQYFKIRNRRESCAVNRLKTMRKFGLIGYPLAHSFSKKHFTEKFQKESIPDCEYELFPLKSIDRLPDLLKQHPDLVGLNVTIPYKQSVFPYLNAIERSAQEVGAVNVIKIQNGQLLGFNSDTYGFGQSLLHFINKDKAQISRALILGTGGAAKAVVYVLKSLKIESKLVSRTSGKGDLTYENITPEILRTHQLIVNTTPLGTSPNIDTCPDLPYKSLRVEHYLFDLVYNPEKTLFLAKGKKQGAKICNGLEMLRLQAEKSWDIWNQ